MKKNDTIRKDATIVAETPVSASVSESNAPKKKRRFNRRTLFKAMFVVSIIFIMISLTYAWFSLSDTANVNGVDLGFTEANSLVAEGVFTKGKIDSVTGNGTSFYKPVMEKQLVGTSNGQNLYKLVKGDTYEQQTDDVTSVNSVVDNVLTVDFTLNIVGKHNIYLVMGSGVSPDGAGAEFLEGAMRVAILKLNEPYRDVLILHIYGDIKLKEIALYYEKSESWAKVTFLRAKSMIMEELKNEGYL